MQELSGSPFGPVLPGIKSNAALNITEARPLSRGGNSGNARNNKQYERIGQGVRTEFKHDDVKLDVAGVVMMPQG